MLQLYDAALSGNCYKVRLLLAHLGLPYRRIAVDLRDPAVREAVLEPLTPFGRVPVLVIDEERILAESGAILWYLSRGTSSVPTRPLDRARMLQWMFFEQNAHEPHLATARLWSILGTARENRKALAERHRAGNAALAILERQLSETPFLAGDRFTVADIALYAYTHVAEEGGFDLGPFASVRSWIGRVASLPGHVRLAGPKA